jgi:hypothetical protein
LLADDAGKARTHVRRGSDGFKNGITVKVDDERHRAGPFGK